MNLAMTGQGAFFGDVMSKGALLAAEQVPRPAARPSTSPSTTIRAAKSHRLSMACAS